MNKKIIKAKYFRGNPIIPGDKSISHRGLIFGALAVGCTEVKNFLESEDVLSTMNCLRSLGVKIEHYQKDMIITGHGSSAFNAPKKFLDCGNSGTTMRVMMGVLAGLPFSTTLIGDESLSKRPMKRVSDPLEKMGASINLNNGNFAPVQINGKNLTAIDYDLKIASAQIKTALLMAALHAEGTTTLTGAIGSRDHTERMLPHFGVKINISNNEIRLKGKQLLKSAIVRVPGDASTAAFWIAACSIITHGQIRIENTSLNPTRTGFMEVLKEMGANIITEIIIENPEPIGRIEVSAAPLRGVFIDKLKVASLIDEIPILAIVATQAHGITEVRGAEELRVKESDRIEAIAINLRAMGANIEIFSDGFRIIGPQKLKGALIHTFNDHRIAMAFSIAGMIADGETIIENSDCVAVSYPRFYETLEELTQE